MGADAGSVHRSFKLFPNDGAKARFSAFPFPGGKFLYVPAK